MAWSPAPGGKLRVLTELRGSRVVVRITNTLPEGQPAHSTAPRGHGIALANVRARLALLHDVQGEFSAAIEDGLYQVRILCRPCCCRPTSCPPTPSRRDAHAMNILIVDDEALARKRLRTLLGDCTDTERHSTAEAATAAEALALLAPSGGRAFDALLLDIHMPGQDGLCLAQASRH